ncbi:MAG TPA: radical SAM protein [Myxococcales bacterium]
MQQLSYGEFSGRFHLRARGQRVPLNATLELTRRCPLACSHCYNNLPMNDSAARQAELSLDEYRQLLDEMANEGCLWLLFTGGEIFARRDFLEIYTHAKKKGFLITLFTNGTQITPSIADYLKEWPPFAIEITFYGRTQATYERLTRVPGSYEKCLRGIRLLKERGLPLKLKTVAVTVNKHEVWEMKELAEDLGLEFKFDSMLNPRIDCSLSPLEVRLRPEEIVELDALDPERVTEWRRFAAQAVGPVHTPDKADELYHCGGGVNSFAINPYGRMSICVLSQADTFDVRRGGFREAWTQSLLKVRQRKISRPTKCVSCQLKALCGMCPANGELENGDPEKPVDFLCHVAHLRAAVLGISVPAHGECEYCVGAKLEEVQRSGAQLRDRYLNVPAAPQQTGGEAILAETPKPAGSCGAGGCSSCAPH